MADDAFERARQHLDAGEFEKAAARLWDAEGPARSNIDRARELGDLAMRLRHESTGRQQREGQQLADYAARHIHRLTTQPDTTLAGRPAPRFEMLGGFGWTLEVGRVYELEHNP